MVGIYKITNPKNKIYVGQTIDWDRRKQDYKYLNCSNQNKLYNSLLKYGWSNHVFELIEECSLGELNNRERYWQDYYNVLEEGLNLKLTQFGDKSGIISIETKNKIALSMKDKNTWSKGGYHKKSVLQYDLEGNFIKDYPSVEEAKKTYNVDIASCCRGESKTSAGFIWFYEEKFNNDLLIEKIKKATTNGNKNKKKSQIHSSNIKKAVTKTNKNKRKPVMQYDLEGNFIKEWEYIRQASNYLNISPSGISNNLLGRYKHAGNYIWKYKNN